MAVLRASFCGLLVACYSPDLPDCRVPCASDGDCAPDQMCGAQAMCARPMMTCPREDGGGPSAVDGPLGDAPIVAGDAMADAPVPGPMQGMLTIHITDRGRVDVGELGSCDTEQMDIDHMDCHFVVDLGVPINLYATPGDGREFDHWSDACSGNQLICVVAPTAPATKASAKFRKD